MHFTFIFWLSTLFSYLINLNYGLKNLFLWIIFRWYIGYRTTSKGYWVPIIKREEYRKKISGKSQEYQRYIGLEPINRLIEVAEEACQNIEVAEEAYQNIGDISPANISDISTNISDRSANISDISLTYASR